ncbi:MAG: hypothetical protein IJZ35_08045 [Clostridia bacterium]|nr:hypothetical protein [Clostridia bacterium]
MTRKRRNLLILITVILIPVVIWLSSIVKCEILTEKYYDDFEYAYKSNSMLGDVEYFKVLRCDEKTAEVYYISAGMTDANVLTFEKSNGDWTETKWETVWSVSGSASDVIYPYWWHFIYSVF